MIHEVHVIFVIAFHNVPGVVIITLGGHQTTGCGDHASKRDFSYFQFFILVREIDIFK